VAKIRKRTFGAYQAVERTCRKCGFVGEQTEFKTGANICKVCNKEYMTQYRENNRPHLNALINKWKKDKRSKTKDASNILVIDDDPTIFELLARHLGSRFGDRVIVSWARDGFEGGQKVTELAPKLVFLDLMMPGINGFEVCKRIKESEKLNCYVVVLTGYFSKENERRSYKAQADLCLEKPLDLDRLAQLTEVVISEGSYTGQMMNMVNEEHALIRMARRVLRKTKRNVFHELFERTNLELFNAVLGCQMKRYTDEECEKLLRKALIRVAAYSPPHSPARKTQVVVSELFISQHGSRALAKV